MALQNLKTYFESTNRNDFMDLLDNMCVVSEKIQASSFHVKRTSTGFDYYKSGSKDSMDRVDRTIVKYYENAIKYFRSLSKDIQEQMPMDWKFGFDYMVDKKTVDIEYDQLPKNHLILTHIQVMSPSNPAEIKKVIRDPNILYKWADILEVHRPQVIFQGHLSDYQKEELVSLLEMNEATFKKEFENKSFTRHLYNIFNRGLNSTSLNTSLDGEIDSLVLNFFKVKSLKSFKLERFDRSRVEEDRKSSDIYQIAILDLVEFISQHDITSIELEESDTDLRYIELISVLFNKYIDKRATKYIGTDFDSADFAKGEHFKLNTQFINNEKTLSLVQKDILAELFKIALGSFRKKRTKETEIINAALMEQINDIVLKIENTVFGETNEDDVMNFNTYLKTQDLQKQVSPITEGLTVKYPEQGKKPVNMFVGRFQPFTLGHAKVIETISKQNGYPVIIFLIKSKTKKKGDAFKRPYDEQTQMSMLKHLKSKYPIEKVYILDRAAIDYMFNAMRADDYEPILWGTGTDRLKTYSYQVDKPEYREDLGVRDDFGLFEIPRTGKNISATQVRNAMLDDDERLFKKLTPKEIHHMYDELKGKLEASMATNESTIMTFDQFTKDI